MKIVFMGTPEFAALCLEKLVQYGHEVLAVFTQPDKFFGRKQVLKCSSVKVKAEQFKILVRQPCEFDSSEINFISSLNPDVIVVVAYGKILPSSVLNIPKFGCVNIHASLLPRHRGASPIQTSIVCGDSVTGVSAIFMSERLDAGDIIGQIETEIGENEKAVDLFERLAILGAELICKVLIELEHGVVRRVVQNEALVTYAPILKKEMGKIDFNKPARMVHKLVCGLSMWPVAFCFFGEKVLKVYSSVCVGGVFNLKPGEILRNDGFLVGCGDGKAVKFLEVQLEGRKKVDGLSFLNGARFEKGFLM